MQLTSKFTIAVHISAGLWDNGVDCSSERYDRLQKQQNGKNAEKPCKHVRT